MMMLPKLFRRERGRPVPIRRQPDPAAALHGEMIRLFEDVGRSFGMPWPAWSAEGWESFTPSIDVAGTDSEVRVTNLPLATYPAAIKEVTPLIDEGKTEDAKAALRAALSTLVVTSHAISLPVVRAQAALDEAKKLSEKEETQEGDTERISAHVESAREQLEMAELLGYAEKEELQEFREQIAEFERKIGAREETTGVFAKLRKSLEGFQVSFFE